MMIEAKEIHWIAGWMEGEGSFGLHRPIRNGVRQRGTPLMSAVTTDRDTARKAARYFKVGKYGPYKQKDRRRKDYYRISLLGKKAVGWMMTLYCLMGERRKEQIRVVLARWKEAGSKSSDYYRKKYEREGKPLPF